MAYPNTLDTFTNPTPTTKVDVLSHADQHAAINNAMEAVQAELGINPKGDYDSVAALLAQMMVWFESVLVQGAKEAPTVQDRSIIRDNADESLTKTTGYLQLPTYTVAGLPSAALYPWQLVGVTNEAGGAVVAFSDGTNWRRVTDRTTVS